MILGLSIMLGAILALLLASAFFSASETALTAVSRARIHALEQDDNRRASLVATLIQTRERLIGAILLGNNLANIGASALATSLFISLFGDAGVAYATIVMTTLVLIFAEVLPKTLAFNNPERFALAFSPIVRFFVVIFAPVTAALQWLIRVTLRLLGVSISDETDVFSAHEEIRGAIELHHKEGGVVKLDRDMLGGVLDLRELSVEDVMVHRTNMDAIDADLPVEEIVDAALKSPHTRIPLWREKPEEIIGILHAKTMLRALRDARGEAGKIDIVALASAPWFVPDSTSLKDQLNAFLKKKAHFAVVVDEYGEVMGLITLEDIIEEIVGDITDETDLASTAATPQSDGSVIAEGSVPIRDLNRLMDWDLPDEEATTIAGLVIHEAQTIPNPGQIFTFHGFRFEVMRRQRNRLTLLRVTPVAEEETENGGSGK
ncbi:HlyC/CorC family transporter [Methyloligella sp. 2.7D]|uniref:HlyC/CorC family transporter n=1 Tax=unclassified Methyloligella TaxID=2625955 RepID=UPI00157DB17F|nr:HlyC/CorC family transporter [Methyloligella sp. GL2]QKP76581.1 HlyC/CorC family transporter [Methyloligella sp. GL2]